MRKGKLAESADVLCPFYQWHDKLRINCEGMDSDTFLAQQFKNCERRERFMLKKCGDKYSSCPVYTLLIEKKYPDAV